MTMSAGQAAAALHEIENTERRTRNANSYTIASPYLILWGVIWIGGYSGSAFLPPERWGLVWLPLSVLGTIASVWLGSRSKASAQEGAFGRAVLMALSIMIFIGCTYFVFKPTSVLPYLVFPTLMAGLVYALAGALARMPRFVWIGAAIWLLTMIGYVAAPAWTAIWVAIAGGGGLVLGGLWLRKV